MRRDTQRWELDGLARGLFATARSIPSGLDRRWKLLLVDIRPRGRRSFPCLHTIRDRASSATMHANNHCICSGTENFQSAGKTAIRTKITKHLRNKRARSRSIEAFALEALEFVQVFSIPGTDNSFGTVTPQTHLVYIQSPMPPWSQAVARESSELMPSSSRLSLLARSHQKTNHKHRARPLTSGELSPGTTRVSNLDWPLFSRT